MSGVRPVWTWPHEWSGMRCMAEMLGSDEKGSPVAVYCTGSVEARRTAVGSRPGLTEAASAFVGSVSAETDLPVA